MHAGALELREVAPPLLVVSHTTLTGSLPCHCRALARLAMHILDSWACHPEQTLLADNIAAVARHRPQMLCTLCSGTYWLVSVVSQYLAWRRTAGDCEVGLKSHRSQQQMQRTRYSG
mmetsp:Transcript_52334/g.83551  ORF Transcript_52334/g.83551 Transcript_52334/m.83551 type:complete len:117 (+) Transcript_52334:267-617(+)